MGGLDRMISRMQSHGTATDDPAADDFLRSNPNALLIGVLLDQQMKAELAFSGPLRLSQRLGHFDMKHIADMDAEAFAEVFAEKPAIHRFPKMMASRVQTLAGVLADEYASDAAVMWADGATLDDIRKRAGALPGFGKAKVATLLHALNLFGYVAIDDLEPCN